MHLLASLQLFALVLATDTTTGKNDDKPAPRVVRFRKSAIPPSRPFLPWHMIPTQDQVVKKWLLKIRMDFPSDPQSAHIWTISQNWFGGHRQDWEREIIGARFVCTEANDRGVHPCTRHLQVNVCMLPEKSDILHCDLDWLHPFEDPSGIQEEKWRRLDPTIACRRRFWSKHICFSQLVRWRDHLRSPKALVWQQLHSSRTLTSGRRAILERWWISRAWLAITFSGSRLHHCAVEEKSPKHKARCMQVIHEANSYVTKLIDKGEEAQAGASVYIWPSFAEIIAWNKANTAARSFLMNQSPRTWRIPFALLSEIHGFQCSSAFALPANSITEELHLDRTINQIFLEVASAGAAPSPTINTYGLNVHISQIQTWKQRTQGLQRRPLMTQNSGSVTLLLPAWRNSCFVRRCFMHVWWETALLKSLRKGWKMSSWTQNRRSLHLRSVSSAQQLSVNAPSLRNWERWKQSHHFRTLISKLSDPRLCAEKIVSSMWCLRVLKGN